MCFLIFPHFISYNSWSVIVVACLLKMPTQLKTSFSFPLLHFPSPDPTSPRSDPLDTSARGDGSLTLFQIQKPHGDAVPPTPWYHSGLITAHRGVVRTWLRKNSQNQNLITGVWATADLRTERPEEGMANSVTKAEKRDGSTVLDLIDEQSYAEL